MKIMFLTYLHGFGGAERQNVMLANAMAERGHDITLVSICADNKYYELDKRIKYIFLPDRKNGLMRFFTRYQDIKKILKKIRPDITVNFWFQSAYMTTMMKKSITGKLIYSERGDPSDKEYSGMLGLIRKLTLPRIDGFVFQSKAAQRYFNETIQSRSIVIPNPVTIKAEDYPLSKKRRKAIVTVGRLHSQKNQRLLIDAFSIIADKIPDYILEIYGEGDLESVLKKQIYDTKLENRVFLRGASKEIHRLIYDSSLFVLSSDYEGLPNVLLEAMALGIPCISTDYSPGGVREIITDGIDGFIVEVGNKYKLADAIFALLNDKDEREYFSNNAIKKIRCFMPETTYDKWEFFFASINLDKNQ